MHKTTTLLLAGLLAASLAGCGGSKQEVKEPETVETQDVEEQAGTEAEETAETEAAEEEAAAAVPAEVTLAEQVIYDDMGVKVTATGLGSPWAGTNLNLLIENNSGQNLTVQSRNVSVNGYMIDTMFSCDVADGKKANDGLTLMSSDLKAAGIETIADIELVLHIFNSDTWDAYADSPKISVKTSAADTYNYAFDDSGTPLYDGNGIRIIAKGLSGDNSFWGPGLIVYIENNSDTDITVQTRDESINGFMVNPIFSCDVSAGKHALDAVTFFDSDLESNGIGGVDDITEIEISFHIFNYDGWDTIADSEPITLTF